MLFKCFSEALFRRIFYRKMSEQNNDPKWKVEKDRILSLSLEEKRKVCVAKMKS